MRRAGRPWRVTPRHLSCALLSKQWRRHARRVLVKDGCVYALRRWYTRTGKRRHKVQKTTVARLIVFHSSDIDVPSALTSVGSLIGRLASGAFRRADDRRGGMALRDGKNRPISRIDTDAYTSTCSSMRATCSFPAALRVGCARLPAWLSTIQAASTKADV